MPASTIVYRDALYAVAVEGPGLVSLTRSEETFNDLTQLETSLGRVVGALEASLGGRMGRGLLIDMRLATPRNSPEFEGVIKRFRLRIHDMFERRAVLMKTQAGRLQLKRLDREQSSAPTQMFYDPAEARRFLRGEAPALRGPAR